ncbi:MAG: hypothetical protein Q9M43_14790 [Sulfurimonas sp.]|nr:hypothetical protein [Sulfurimonas sp.]
MKRLLLSALTLWLLFSFSGCSSSPEDSLKSHIEKYKECFINGNYKCVVSYSDPEFIKFSGGVDKLAEGLKESLKKMKISIKINNISEIKNVSDKLQANVTSTTTMEILDECAKQS